MAIYPTPFGHVELPNEDTVRRPRPIVRRPDPRPGDRR
jgi:hypothetical protein